MRVAAVYPAWVAKAQKKGRTRAEVDAAIGWLTGHDPASLAAALAGDGDLEAFVTAAPFPPEADLVRGVVCGVRVEEVADPAMRRVRQIDKIVDELAKGKALAKVIRAGAPTG